MTLQFYFARRFLISLLIVAGVFAGLIFMVDTVEYLQRFTEEAFGVPQAAWLAFLNLPGLIYEIIPLIVILATLAMFLRLARTSELIVTRAAGRSAIRSLIAPTVVAAAIGVLGITAFNPLVAATSNLFEEQIADFRGQERSVLSVSQEGLWLRQRDGDGQMVIRAQEASLGGTVLYNVTFLSFDANAQPKYRIEAQRAELVPGAWEITDAKRWDLSDDVNPETTAVLSEELRLLSSLTLEQIRDSFAKPSSIPFWDLPKFIEQLEDAGFAANRHRVWFHMELANPLFLATMVLIGAAFTMRHTRLGRTGLMVLLAVLTGFAMYFLRNFAQVLGETGDLPVMVAAWAPPVAGLCLSLALLLHQEDG